MADWPLLSQQTQPPTLPYWISNPHMQNVWMGGWNILSPHLQLWSNKPHKIPSFSRTPITSSPYSNHEAAYQLPEWPQNSLTWNSTPWVRATTKSKKTTPLGGPWPGYVNKLHPKIFYPSIEEFASGWSTQMRRKSRIKRNKRTDQPRRI